MADGMSTARRIWTAPAFSWALVALGMSLFILLRVPSLARQVALFGEHATAHDLAVLAGLSAVAALPVIGLWRLSARLGLPRALSLLYLAFPIATAAIYLLWPLLSRIRPNR